MYIHINLRYKFYFIFESTITNIFYCIFATTNIFLTHILQKFTQQKNKIYKYFHFKQVNY